MTPQEAEEALITEMHRELETPHPTSPEGWLAHYKKLDAAVRAAYHRALIAELSVIAATPSSQAAQRRIAELKGGS